MTKESRNVLIVIAVFVISLVAVLLAWGVDEIVDGVKHIGSSPKQIELTKEQYEEAVQNGTLSGEEEVIREEAPAEEPQVAEAAAPAEAAPAPQPTGTYIPSSPQCNVSGNLPGYGQYQLVVYDNWGQISPGVPSKAGKLNEISYDNNTGYLTMNAYTMKGVFCGSYCGYLVVENGIYKYQGSFCNSHGKESSFVMTGR